MFNVILKLSSRQKPFSLFLLIYCSGMNPVFAQTMSEQQASKETHISDLQLLRSTNKESRINILGINLGYVEKDTKPGNGKYLCGALKRSKAIEAGTIIIKALSTMSDASLKKIELKYIVLCSHAMAKGRRIGGIPVPTLKLLMLDVGENSGDSSYLQRIFLHELYHLIEYRFDTFRDKTWEKRFGAGYANSYSSQLTQSRIGSGKKGFLNSYSQTYPHEDRAELFANLLLAPIKVIKYTKSKNDQLLKEKVRYMAEKIEQMMGTQLSLNGL